MMRTWPRYGCCACLRIGKRCRAATVPAYRCAILLVARREMTTAKTEQVNRLRAVLLTGDMCRCTATAAAIVAPNAAASSPRLFTADAIVVVGARDVRGDVPAQRQPEQRVVRRRSPGGAATPSPRHAVAGNPPGHRRRRRHGRARSGQVHHPPCDASSAPAQIVAVRPQRGSSQTDPPEGTGARQTAAVHPWSTDFTLSAVNKTRVSNHVRSSVTCAPGGRDRDLGGARDLRVKRYQSAGNSETVSARERLSAAASDGDRQGCQPDAAVAGCPRPGGRSRRTCTQERTLGR